MHRSWKKPEDHSNACLPFRDMNNSLQKFSDVIIVGSGVAGLTTALELSIMRPDLDITVLSKSRLSDGSTSLAQGGMAVPIDELDKQQHIEDTFIAGRYENDESIVRLFIDELPKSIARLETWGMQFDKTDKGLYHYHLEGGHTIPRVVHCKDHTGLSLHQVLYKNCSVRNNIHFAEYVMAYDLLPGQSEIALQVFDVIDQTKSVLLCSKLVLAGGGIGALFHFTTNDATSTGDAIAMACRAGIKVGNLSSVQFHPTALNIETQGGRLPLITEALRGAGAFLLDDRGKRFMYKYDPRAELATRDVISQSIWKEMGDGMERPVYLDARHLDELKDEFPTVCRSLLDQGYDLCHEVIPVIPAAHYLCGGIESDLNGQTSHPHILAVGECAHTHLHGRNRLASNSLTEALVMGLNAANQLAAVCVKSDLKGSLEKTVVRPMNCEQRSEILEQRKRLSLQLYAFFRERSLGVSDKVRDLGQEAGALIGHLLDQGHLSLSLLELRNLTVVGHAMLRETADSNHQRIHVG